MIFGYCDVHMAMFSPLQLVFLVINLAFPAMFSIYKVVVVVGYGEGILVINDLNM